MSRRKSPRPRPAKRPTQPPPADGIDRREFGKRALGVVGSAFAAPLIVPRHVWGGPGYTPPSEVITRAVIGTGGMGMGHVVTNQPGRPPVTLAVCDVDRQHLANAKRKAGDGCEAFSDWRHVLERRDIDTIHIATPPHWHALIGIACAQAGFDILSEKPFTRTIHEGQVYRDTVARYGRMLQINTHGRFGNYYGYGASKALKKLVDSGRLGSPLTVRVGHQQGLNWKIRQWSGRTNLKPQPVPEQLDYDMWLGPAPVKPYHPHRVHGSFRGYWDYDGGGLTDMGQHYLDPVQYILGKDDTGPVEIWADAESPQHPDAVGLWSSVHIRYADGDTIILESGEWGKPGEPGRAFIEGPNGRVFGSYRTDPAGLIEETASLPDPPPLINFETAVRTRERAGGNESVSHRSCSLVNLASLAIRIGRKLTWDPQLEQFVGDDFANRFVRQPMRSPWIV